MRTIEGRARRLGDDINTDYIIASSRKRDTLDANVLKRYLLESIDSAFAATVQEGDVLVAGRNFGCGSAMEVAATVILAAGIRAVLAASFSRTFYRNAINNGLVPVQCDTSAIQEGHRLVITMLHETLQVQNTSTNALLTGLSLPPIMLSILETGGLVPYMREHGQFVVP